MEASTVRARLASENGFAMVTVIGVMIVALAFAGAAAVAAINSLHGTVRDTDSKMALGAADAGAAAALARQNSIAQSGDPCLTPGTGGLLVSAPVGTDGWCPAVSGSIDEGTFSYQVGPRSDGSIRVVSVGTFDGVNRRIELTATNSAGSNVFADASVLGQEGITMDSNAEVHADAATNGSISLAANARLCGYASVGVGETVTTDSNATHGGSKCTQSTYDPVAQAPLSLDAVQQGDVVTNNSNYRLETGEDLIQKGKSSSFNWDPVTRDLTLGANVVFVLGGSNYSFCSLSLSSNSELVIAEGASVRIFFDSPENCGGETVPLSMSSNSKISATGGNSTKVALLFVGSDEIATRIELNSNAQPNADCSSEFVIYAPKTDLVANSNVTYCGAIAAQSIHLDSNSVIRARSETTDFELPGAGPHFVAERFVECTAATPETTGEGC